MKIAYRQTQFRQPTLDLIDRANVIIEEYLEAGFKLTLRQLYYQFVARDLLPNTQQSYKRLGDILGDARNAGLVSWEAIEDRTRELRDNAHWDSPAEILETCAATFRYDLWADQPYRPEVWIEKDALVGVFLPTCQSLDVPLFSCRGYTSLSETWEAGRRLLGHIRQKQGPVILHFGDHDPSGLDMTRDLRSRLALYSEHPVEVERLALNMDQVEEHRPPPNPAKVTDSRYTAYVAIHGDECWELDALEPAVLAGLIEEAVDRYRDEAGWSKALRRQDRARRRLSKLSDDYSE